MPQYRQATRRFLATVLFTDIVGSTERAAGLGDRKWRDLLERHNAVVRRELKAFGGREMDTAGDGFFAVFETPERAVRAAESIISAVPPLGIAIRAGVHMGECEMVAGKVGGMTVVIGARIASLAEPGQVLVSGSVRDLMTGSGMGFAGGEPHVLKGVADQWRVYRLVPDQVDGDTTSSRRSSIVPLYTRRQRRRLLVAVAAAIALILALSGGYLLAQSEPEVVVGENAVGLLDGDTVTDAFPVGERPTGIASGAGAVWVTNSAGDTVSRIDPDTRLVVPIPVGSAPAGIAVGAGSVWVANSGDSTVSRIDPKTYRATKVPVLSGPSGVVVAAGSVWVTNSLAGAVTRINPRTNKVSKVARVGANPTGIAYGAGSLWVTLQSEGTVTRLDPRSLRKVATITVGAGPAGIAFGDGAIWVANSIDGSLARINVDDHSMTSRAIDPKGGANGVAVDGRTVWVSNQYAGTLSEVDSRRFTIVGTVQTGGAPFGLAVSGDRLWFATAGAGTVLHRGGVLRFAATGLAQFGSNPAVVDPAGAYDGNLWRLLAMTNDGLVGYRRSGGVSGSLLVADLATALPVPTDAGLTYTFHLRKGVRYSTGALVRPRDIRRGIERAFLAEDGPYTYYTVIKGAESCLPPAGTCDLSAGVLVDDRARTVTFRLTRREPDFLPILALPAAYATPSGSLVRSGAPVPATGPYMVKDYDPAPIDAEGAATGPGRLELVRNPHFREWSPAAQPDGFADRIVIDTGMSDAQASGMVAEGRADAVWGDISPQQFARLQPRFPSQVHKAPGSFMYYVFLNTARPPFDNLDARRAVAYAMDRRKMASDPELANYGQVTCQVLPPDFPGHDPYCPYTLDGGGPGEWTAPDVAEAQRLVRVSGTRGARVRVATIADTAYRKPNQQLADLLSSLGYRASLRVIAPRLFYDTINGRDDQVNAGITGFGPDFPGQTSYLPPLVACKPYPSSFNPSFYCNPDLDRQIEEVLDRQTVDPAGAAVLWTAIDRAVVDEAPIIPFSNDVRYDFVSARLGNYQRHPQLGPLPAQMWVQ